MSQAASASASSSSSPSPSTSTSKTRTFDELVKEEEAIQDASLDFSGGVPTCLKIFDRYIKCYGKTLLVAFLLFTKDATHLFIYCYFLAKGLASQTTSLYRQGRLKEDCQDIFHDWAFCLTLRGLEPEEKRRQWIQRRAEWWARRRLGRSSEDVWDAR
jgi:hypothetical protein